MTDEQMPRRLDPRHSMDGDLTNRFTYHPPEPEQPEVYQLVRDVAHLLALVVESSTYPCPERSLAVTRVEEAVMWANAAIARRGLSGGGIAGAGDLLTHALQALYVAKPGSLVVEDVDVPVPDDAPKDPWAEERTRTTDDTTTTHPGPWTTTCAWCPAYIDAVGPGAQREAQEWLLDHAEQVHGKALRDG